MNVQDNTFTVTALCRQEHISRQAYYKGLKQAEKRRIEHQNVLAWVREIRARHPRMGGRKLYYRLRPAMNKEGIKMGRDQFFELLSEQGLLVKPRKSRAPRTTNGAWTQWTNELAQKKIEAANQAWVADITYLRTFDGFSYLALISDKYSRKILGRDVAESLELAGALRALGQALSQLEVNAAPIHHSDRGSQYRSKAYIQALKKHKCIISMTEDDHCAENAQAERLNGILKNEYLLD